MNTSCQQCATCGNCGVSLEFQPGFPFGFHSCRPRQMSGRCGGVPGTHRRLNPEEYTQWDDGERMGQETPRTSSGWWRRRWTKEVICSSLSKKKMLKIVHKALFLKRGLSVMSVGLLLGWCPSGTQSCQQLRARLAQAGGTPRAAPQPGGAGPAPGPPRRSRSGDAGARGARGGAGAQEVTRRGGEAAAAGMAARRA